MRCRRGKKGKELISIYTRLVLGTKYLRAAPYIFALITRLFSFASVVLYRAFFFFYRPLSVNLILPRPLGREIRKARTVRLIKLRSTLSISCFFSFSSFFSPVFSLPLYTLHSRVGSPRLFSGPSFLLRSAPFFICVEIHPSSS